MKQVLLKVDYIDNSDKFWSDSYVKNIVCNVIDNDINKTVAMALDRYDNMKMSYNGKPITNIFVNDKNGQGVAVGYIYRTQTDIFDENKRKYVKAYFDAWVEIKEVNDYKFKIIK